MYSDVGPCFAQTLITCPSRSLWTAVLGHHFVSSNMCENPGRSSFMERFSTGQWGVTMGYLRDRAPFLIIRLLVTIFHPHNLAPNGVAFCTGLPRWLWLGLTQGAPCSGWVYNDCTFHDWFVHEGILIVFPAIEIRPESRFCAAIRETLARFAENTILNQAENVFSERVPRMGSSSLDRARCVVCSRTRPIVAIGNSTRKKIRTKPLFVCGKRVADDRIYRNKPGSPT